MRHTLLLVDDEENILRALTRLFHRTGHEILTASSGAEGLEVVRGRPVSLIVSDQRMPGMSGPSSWQRLAGCNPRRCASC